LAIGCSSTSASEDEIVATLDSTPVTRRELDAAVARLGLPACDSLRLLLEGKLLQKVCGDDAGCEALTAGQQVAPETMRQIREDLLAGSPYLATRRRRSDSFLSGFAADRAIRAQIDRRLSDRRSKVSVKLRGCREE
jgi:hypothetical protein